MGEVFGIPLLKLADILAVPITVGVAVPFINWLQKKRELALENQRAQDDALRAYLDQMSALMSDKNQPLRKAKPGDDLSAIARAQTLTVLKRLEGARRGNVLEFLYQSGLIFDERRVFALMGANLHRAHLRGVWLGSAALARVRLSEADLREAYLFGINLSAADLRRADLRGAFLPAASLAKANLRGANLGGCYLFGADLSDADLSGAKLVGTHLGQAEYISDPDYEAGTLMSPLDALQANLARSRRDMDRLMADMEHSSRFVEAEHAAREHEAQLYDIWNELGLHPHPGEETPDWRQRLIRYLTDTREKTTPTFERADLTGADLSGAIVSAGGLQEIERGAKSLKGTTMPDGSKHR